MGAFDYQFGVKNEVTFNTPLTVDRFFEYSGDPMPIHPIPGRTEGNPLLVGSRARRAARTIPFFDHAEGHVDLDVMNKGFGFWLGHMLPTVATTGAGPYTHTATEGATNPIGKSFTGQFNAPFSPAGTNQAFTFSGGKVAKWSLSNDVTNMLVLGLDLWFASMATGTALATAAYPASMTNFAWSHGVVSVGGSAFDITSINIECDLGQGNARPQIRGSSTSKEPVPGTIEVTFSLEADFDTLTQFNRVHSATVAGLSAAILGTWTNGTDIIVASIPAGRFDDFEFGGDPGSLTQTLTGVGEDDTTAAAPISVIYTTSDVTP